MGHVISTKVLSFRDMEKHKTEVFKGGAFTETFAEYQQRTKYYCPHRFKSSGGIIRVRLMPWDETSRRILAVGLEKIIT